MLSNEDDYYLEFDTRRFASTEQQRRQGRGLQPEPTVVRMLPTEDREARHQRLQRERFNGG